MPSKGSLVAKAFGNTGSLSPLSDRNIPASDRKLSSTALGVGVSGQRIVANISDMTALTDLSSGDIVLVTATNKLYVWNGSGFYVVATVENQSPSAITGVDGTYALAKNGTATTVTAISTDPEGLTLNWSYAVQSGSLTNGGGVTATVTQGTGSNTHVFTITPTTTEAYAGEFTLRFSATDGVNGAVVADSVFTLAFTVQNSRYNAISIRATTAGTNQTFDDASASNNTITVSGNVTASTFSPTRHGGYATYFDGNDRIDVTTGLLGSYTAGNASSSTFTIESWVYQEARGANNGIDGNAASIISKWLYFNFGIDDNGHLHCHHYSGSQHNLETTASVPLQTWTHVAMVVTGAQVKLYINGTLGATGTWYGMQAATSLAGIGGSNQSHPEKFTGYMHDIRVSNNARYTTNFTPVNSLTTDSNTDLLIGKLQIRDLSSNSVSLTPQGDAKVVAFNTSTGDNGAYSETENGASAKIESAGSNRLTSPITAMGTGDFTISGWVHTIGTNNPDIIFDTRPISADASTGFYLAQYNAGYFYVGTANNDFGPIQGTTNYPKNSWNHFAIVRDSSGNLKMYINGNLEGTDAIGTSKDLTSTDITIGSNRAGSSTCHAHVSDLRIVHSVLYTTNFTPPTAPSTTTPTYSTLAIGVANSGSSAYTLSGDVTGNNATVNMAIGQTVNFTVNASGHPFYIRVSNGGANVSTPAATGQGATSGVVSWTPNTAGTYYYQCSVHSGMIGTINVTDGVKFLLNPDPSIIDLSQKAPLSLFGNTTGSTTQVKFAGTKSIYFDGSGDYLQATLQENLGTGLFTIECFIYPTALSGNRGVFQLSTAPLSDTSNAISIFHSNVFGHQFNGTNNGSTTITANQWYHLALVRDSNSLVTLYVDGTSYTSWTKTNNAVDYTELGLGSYKGTSANFFSGYIQDFRITKGLARYTSNFTPPAAELEG